MLLEGLGVVLAGGTGRVGGATLRTAVAAGARVLVLSRSRESAERTIATLGADVRERALPFEGDLLHEEDGESVVREAFKDLLKDWGRSRDLHFVPEQSSLFVRKSDDISTARFCLAFAFRSGTGKPRIQRTTLIGRF